MIWTLLAVHVAALPLVGAVGWRWGIRAGLAVALIPPAVTAVWAIERLILGSDPMVVELVWVEALDLTLRFRSDAMALLMTTLVSGIGALVFVYAIGYFERAAAGAVRFPVTLLAFSVSMLGLVLADSAWTLFVFWELTSITSFALVAHKNTDPGALQAARRALVITAAGGLALLVGLLALGQGGGTSNLTDLVPIEGPRAHVGALLIMAAAATKSAQVPFHVWLPGAMAAPTPVSAYLHSATMVKAGVLLVAVVGPAFTSSPVWEMAGLAFGVSSMLWGAIGALRHTDAKLILAWGTVSQLGLLITLLALGTAKATFAAIAMLFTHALFKAALFVVVGEIDVRTGTRDITKLKGLGRTMPVAALVAVLAGLSMAGVPPLLGFAAKEAAIEAALGLEGVRLAIVGTAIIGGAVLTGAYTFRLLIGLFGPARRRLDPSLSEGGLDPACLAAPTEPTPRRLSMTVPGALLSLAGLFGFVALAPVNAVVGPAAIEIDRGAEVYQLLRWPGLTLGLFVSAVVVVAGAALGGILGHAITNPAPWAGRLRIGAVPRPLGATSVDLLLDGVLSASRRIIGRVQHGSLPIYLVTMVATVVLAGSPFLAGLSFEWPPVWDRPLQLVLALVITASAIAGTMVKSRLGAALTLGSVGICVSGLFVLHGAPDLVLTQLLVETIVVVGFVIGLGHLARRFPAAPDGWKAVRIVVAALAGAAVCIGLVATGANPAGFAPVDRLRTSAINDGGGENVVNVILTDVRALDTLGEVVVLAVVAVGILALANVRRLEVRA